MHPLYICHVRLRVGEANFIKEWMQNGALLSSQKGSLILGWGERVWSRAPSALPTLPSFYFPDFFLCAEKPWFTHQYACELTLQEVISLMKKYAPCIQPSCIAWRQPDEGHFQRTFEDLQQRFLRKELDKAVPYLFETSEQQMGLNQLTASLLSLLNYEVHNPAHLYGFWGGKEGVLGATPEILFKFIDHKKLETVACAGTMGEQRDASAFIQDPKEQHEHQLVIDGIRQALASFGKVDVKSSYLLKLSRLVHIATPILIELDHRSFTYAEIVDALHPTPAVGTFPKAQGAKWLEEYQSEVPRGRFGAPCGALFPDPAKSSCFVSIRNVHWSEKGLKIGAGCGLVAESAYALEWAEIKLKLRAIKEMLAL